jgi:nucleotide-binding universal stress UspA family protein
MRRIVVGVVDSPDGRAALRVAGQLAHEEHAVVTAVTVYRPPVPIPDAGVPVPVLPADLASWAEHEQAHALACVIHDVPDDVVVQFEVRQGDPAAVLCDRAADADLLVVGRRSSRLRRWLSGSVSRACANRAGCPVVIVREGVRQTAAAEPAAR